MGLFDTFKKAAKGPGAVLPSEKNPTVAAAKSVDVDAREAVMPSGALHQGRKHLLFINVPSASFQPIQTALFSLAPEWDARLVEDVSVVPPAVGTRSYHAVVLSSESAANPAIESALNTQSASLLRIVLGDVSDGAAVARWSAAGAHCLPALIDAPGFVTHLKRITQVQEWLTNAGMKKLLAQCRKLPVMSKLYEEVAAELDSPTGSLDKVAHFVAKDPLMTAKILQVINSASFALGRQINDVCEAVMYLGMGRTRALILTAGTFSQFENVNVPGFSPEQIWNHSLQVATLAQIVSLEETKDAKLGEAAFTSGLMHDMGKLILAANVPAMSAAVAQLQQRKQLSQRAAELQVLGTTHAELAACLLGTWGLPLSVLEAVAWHHCPARTSDTVFTPLTAVHAANVFSYEMGVGPAETAERFDHEYLLQIGLGDRRNHWRETCGLPPKEDEEAEHKRARLRCESKLN